MALFWLAFSEHRRSWEFCVGPIGVTKTDIISVVFLCYVSKDFKIMACCNMRMTLCVCVFEWMWVKTILTPIDPQIIKMQNFTHEDHMVHGAHVDAFFGVRSGDFWPTFHLTYCNQTRFAIYPSIFMVLGARFLRHIAAPSKSQDLRLRLVDVPAINRDASGSKLRLSISTVMWSLAHRFNFSAWFCQHDGARQRQRQEHQRGKKYSAREVARWHF